MRLILILIGVILLPPCAGVAAADEATTPPNVLLILVDDLGYGDLSSYGAEDLDTPYVDGLVREGMRFSNFYANCPVCSPTRAALLSGRYQEAVGVPGVIRTHSANSWGYLSEDALLPAALKPAGYRTAMVGKWHLGLGEPNLPNLRGFDYFYGFLGDMMDDYYNHRRHGFNYMKVNTKEIDPAGHATDLFSKAAAEWIEQQNDESPFFIYLPYNAPHNPIQPPDDFLEKYRKKHPAVGQTRAKLAAFIEHMDFGIGQVLGALDRSGRAEDTLVIFTSDNGGMLRAEANNGPLRDGKGTTYEGGIRVATTARWPGKIEPGSHSDVVALSMDLYPTILEAAGLVPQEGLDGVSILPILLGQTDQLASRDVVFSRLMPPGRIYAVRRGQYKLVRPSPDKPLELYDLAGDPLETTNLAESRAALFRQLKEALDAHIGRFADVPWRLPGGIGPGEVGPPNTAK